MANEYPHLDLPIVPDLLKKKGRRGEPLPKIIRDYENFTKTQTAKLDKITDSYKRQQEKTPDYKQDLVFKMKTAQKVHDEQFRMELSRAGIETLVSNPGEKTDWIVTATDTSFSKLKEKLKNREKSKNATFVDGIETFDEFSPEDKLGDVLKKKPLDRLEVVNLVVNLVKKEGEENEAKMQAAIQRIEHIANRFGFQVLDRLVTEFLCDLLVQVNREMLREILEIDMVIEVDRPHGFEVEDILEKDLKDIQIGRTPTLDSHGILVMD